MKMNGDVKMKLEQEINNQYRIIRKIYNNRSEIFDWSDLRVAVDALIEMKIRVASLKESE